jgi:hypothetical protein
MNGRVINLVWPEIFKNYANFVRIIEHLLKNSTCKKNLDFQLLVPLDISLYNI